MLYEDVLKRLKSFSNPKNVEGMARFGINPKNTLGVSMPVLRKVGKELGKNHDLALKLWSSRIHEARILAALVDDPKKVTEKQMDSWVKDFDSWDVCDQVCMNLFDKTPFATKKVFEWAAHEEEFVRRAAFSLMASLSFHNKSMPDSEFRKFFPIIKKYSCDERNFVKKSVNWALRQIGKRNKVLNKEAVKTADEILRFDSKAAKWIATDALKELKNEKIIKKLRL
ncbi:MAG: DNA alkylation repair protein [Candidatus Nanoarchaeia archaeon]